ncbi:MAG: hypothetical protein KF851_03665 [Pirellulaceae bacterium]|nr:hypothetical protein [Pirellulaceae bacterium]
MTFDPTNPDGWSNPISPKSTPQDSLRELFNSDSVEFEPIDDDEDSELDIPVGDLSDSDSRDEVGVHPSDRVAVELDVNPPFVKDDAVVARDRNSDEGSRRGTPTRPPQPPKPPTAEAKPQTSHWDLLASQLGLGGGTNTDSENSGSASASGGTKSNVADSFTESDEKSSVTDSPLRELFIPSGEAFEESAPRIVDDLSVEIDEGYIEFEVEDLVPDARRPERGPKRESRQRPDRKGPSDERKPRREEMKRDNRGHRDAQSKSEDEPAPKESRSERGERTAPPAKEKRTDRKETAASKEREPRREDQTRVRKKKPAPVAPPVQHDDDEDDFVEITDDNGSDKNITTWRQAISAIVETNIKNHESSSQRNSGNRGKRPRKDGDRRN